MGKRFVNALSFLTVIKTPQTFTRDEKDITGSIVYFPLVGIIIGIFISVFFFVMNLFLPLLLTVILTIIFEIIITGAAHIVGMANMFDGVFSDSRGSKKILAIIKKRDVGVYGILSIILLVILKTALLYFLAKGASLGKLTGFQDLTGFYIFLVFMPGFGRWGMNHLIANPVRKLRDKNGRKGFSLANVCAEDKKKERYFYISSAYFIVMYFLLVNVGNILRVFFEDGAGFGISSPIESYWVYLYLISATTTLIILVNWFFTRRAKGVTEDIIGGVSEITEVLFCL